VEDWICLWRTFGWRRCSDHSERSLKFSLPIVASVDPVRRSPTAVFIIAELLIGSAQPGILPSHRDVLEVPPKPDVGAIAVAYFQTLVLAQWD
jgi:hypothetical protein